MAEGDFSSNQPTDASTGHGILGWREWLAFPELGIPAIKAKVDTGARTSALHALDIRREDLDDGSSVIHFSVQPLQRKPSLIIPCQAPLVDVRRVTDSGGHIEERFFVRTQVAIGNHTRSIEMTLTERDGMLFRMLLGRTAMKPDIMVNPAQSYTLGKPDTRRLYSSFPRTTSSRSGVS